MSKVPPTRDEMINRIINETVEAEIDGGVEDFLRSALYNGLVGYKDISDDELLEEYEFFFGQVSETNE